MRKVDKGPEPISLVNFRTRNPQARYEDLQNLPNGPETRRDIRSACLSEQFYLCAYCSNTIAPGSCHNEHIIARDVNPNLSLTYTNIVASCNSPHNCGEPKRTQTLPITPFQQSCETDIRYYLSGAVTGTTPAATDTIAVLKLDNDKLSEVRYRLVQSLIFVNNENPATIALLENDLLDMVIADVLTPESGKLEAFAPVLANILENFKM